MEHSKPKTGQLRFVRGASDEVDALFMEMDLVFDAIEDGSLVAEPPHDFLVTLDALSENMEFFVVSKRDIRATGNTNEMVVSLNPTPRLRAFVTALRAWKSGLTA